MIFSCSILLIGMYIIFLLCLILFSRKINSIILFSIVFSLLITILFYVLNNYNIVSLKFFNNIVIKIINKLKFSLDSFIINKFALACNLIIIFVVCFIITIFITNKIFYFKNNNTEKNRIYYLTKSIIIVFNSLLSIMLSSFFISTLNIAYNMNEGFLSFIFDLASKGIEML